MGHFQAAPTGRRVGFSLRPGHRRLTVEVPRYVISVGLSWTADSLGVAAVTV